MKSLIPFLYVALLFVSCSGNKQISSELNRYVDPFIGTTYTGHTFPGATYPLGMVQPLSLIHIFSECSEESQFH